MKKGKVFLREELKIGYLLCVVCRCCVCNKLAYRYRALMGSRVALWVTLAE